MANYGLELERRGAELVGLCPFHEETKGSFRVNLEKKVFHCFGCRAKGNVLDFVARLEEVSIREAALLVAEWSGLGEEVKTPPGARERPSQPRRKNNLPPDPTGDGKDRSPRGVEESDSGSSGAAEPTAAEGNPPLELELKLDPDHPYLDERGIARGTRETFGIGYCGRGLMRGRVAFPIHDHQGRKVAYCGRWAAAEIPEGEDRYKLPKGFLKAEVLFNLHRVREAHHLVLVEGPFSVFRLHELGIPAVALLGSTISPGQCRLLYDAGTKAVTVLMDGDEPGREAAGVIAGELLAYPLFVRVIRLPDGAEPDTMPETELRALVQRPR